MSDRVVGFICQRSPGRRCEPILASDLDRGQKAAERIIRRGELLTVDGIAAELEALTREAGPQLELALE